MVGIHSVVSINQYGSEMLFDKVGIGTTTITSDLTLQVGSGSSLFSIDGSGGVGIGTTANGLKLNIEGDVRIGGFTIYGDGSGITNQDSIWAKGGGNTYVFTKDDADLKVSNWFKFWCIRSSTYLWYGTNFTLLG